MRSRNLFSRRLLAVSLVCLGFAGAIVARMFYLSVVLGPELAGQAERITCGDAVRMSYRGSILDRNNAVLATSIGGSRVAMRRAVYTYDSGDAAALAPLLGTDEQSLDALLRDDPRKFIWVTKSAGVDEANAIRRLGIRGIDVHSDQRRSYPQGPLAAHLIGFTGGDSQGLEGIERLFDEGLRGVPQTVRVCKDVRGRVFYSTRDVSGMNRGAAVELTIDATLQSIAEAELNKQIQDFDASGGSVVILDPATGEVLAMANAPSFDPNDYRISAVSDRRNRAITDIFEPGSTMKPIVVAAALDSGVIVPSDIFYCEDGAMRIGGWTIHDHHPHGHLNVAEILKVSSNICAAKIGAMLGPDTFHGYLNAFGFGRKTGIGLTGEAVGMLAPPSRWRAVHIANISFGQGIAVSAMQLASGFSVLANDGVRMRPHVVRRITGGDGVEVRAFKPQKEGRVISAEVARLVSKMLEAVVAPGGTAPRARLEGIRVAGKTGTAQKAENGRYSKDRWLASFVGYLPADDPQLVIVVMIDEPMKNHFGGVVAAPVFRRIAEASLDYLHIHRVPDVDGSLVMIDASVPLAPRPSVASFDGTMPDLHGLSLRSAMRAIDGCGCAVNIEGTGYVVAQEPEPGAVLARAAAVSLTLDASVSH